MEETRDLDIKESKNMESLVSDRCLVKGSTEFNNNLVVDYRQLSVYLCRLKEG